MSVNKHFSAKNISFEIQKIQYIHSNPKVTGWKDRPVRNGRFSAKNISFEIQKIQYIHSNPKVTGWKDRPVRNGRFYAKNIPFESPLNIHSIYRKRL
jgi:hypothetical protein